MGTVCLEWFSTSSSGAVRDFFELCDQTLLAMERDTGALDQLRKILPGDSLGLHTSGIRELVQQARGGNWQPLEHSLQVVGATYARAECALSSCYGVASRFYDAMIPCAVASYAAEPARLSAVLQVLGESIRQALSIVVDSYHQVKGRHREQWVEESPGLYTHVLEQAQFEREDLERAQNATQNALARSAARLEILSSAGHEFAAASGNIERVLGLVARRLAEIIGEGCAVRLISHDGAWLEPSTSFYHRDPERSELARRVLATERQRMGEGLAGRAAATGLPVLIPVIDTDQFLAATAPAFRPMLARLGVTSALAIPLRSRDRTIGAISLLKTDPGNPYTLDDQHLAQDLADRAGLAIDNAILVATLEQRVAERTAALEASNRDLEAFSYSVSHDLRTPLRAIDGFSRALLADYEDRLDDRAQHYLRRIRAGTQRMAELIDDLLELARITRAPVRREVLDLSALAASVVAELHKREPTRTIPVHVAPGLTARADARLLRIALENLLGNAWKFTAKHSDAQIWFGADPAAFHVRDTGAGFDMAYAEKLFAPFQRLHAPKEYDGTGVGLAIVHRIITHHGGGIWAEAQVGKGATFFFTLGDHA